MTKIIEVSEETWAKIKDQVEKEGGKDINIYNNIIGKKIFFRTVTYHALGEVDQIFGKFVHLKNASWVADTGRFMDFIKDGIQENSEIEPVAEMFLNMDTVVDFFIWKHSMPEDQK